METNETLQQTKQYIEVNPTIQDDDNPIAELFLYSIIIIIPVLVTLLFYAIKKLLKKLGFLTKKISDVLDKLQVKVTNAATKASTKLLNKKYKINKQVPTSGLAVDISEKINDTLSEKLKVEVEDNKEQIEEKK